MSNGLEKPQSEISITVPGFKTLAPLSMSMHLLKEGERRIPEAKMVNPSTYVELEHTFQQAYGELKRNLAAVDFQIAKLEKEIERTKATLLFEVYPEFIKDKPKNYDNATTRNLFLVNNPEIKEGEDNLIFLKRLAQDLEGRVKNFENVCRYVRKQMDILLRQTGPSYK